MERTDLVLLHHWLHEPHVAPWWNESLSLEEVHAKYGPRIDGLVPTHMFIIEYAATPVGWIQWYLWSDYQKHAGHLGAGMESAGIDLTIGEKEMIGRGIGPAAIRQFVKKFIFVDPAISGVFADPDLNNNRSVRAFAKAGFEVVRTVNIPGESCTRSVVHLARSNHEKV
jgi:RimJ/RimL family protein N-acetyltransferase